MSNNKLILLAEDDDLNSDMLSRRLIKRGFRVVIAQNGQQALSLAKNIQPNLILLDLNLPIINGWQVSKSLKQNQDTSHIPIIAVSAYSLQEDKQKSFSSGCNAFNTKPVDINLLIETINKFL